MTYWFELEGYDEEFFLSISSRRLDIARKRIFRIMYNQLRQKGLYYRVQ